MSGTPHDKRELDDEDEERDAPLDPIDELASAGDVAALLSLARDYRVGTGDTPKDLGRCMASYRAAAALGSAEAAYALALFHLTGGVVPQDLEKGAAHLRTAADAGSIPAKVYVANLYELGIYYARDAEKADVFYRSAARAADVRVTEEERMADLGSVRHGLLLMGRATTDTERTRWLRKMRAYGYQLHERAAAAAAPAPVVAAPAPKPAPAPAAKPAPAPAPTAKPAPAPKPIATAPARKPGRVRVARVFLVFLLLAVLAAGAYAAYRGGYLNPYLARLT